MPTYMTLIRYTQQGIESIKDSPARLDTAKDLFKSLGAEIKSFFLTMGKYDVMVISEAPDDETATKLAMTIGSSGAIRTETFRIFTEDEYRKLISELP
ncbi:MAG: GYD domain-containing protein [Desulfobulbia bacterium]